MGCILQNRAVLRSDNKASTVQGVGHVRALTLLNTARNGVNKTLQTNTNRKKEKWDCIIGDKGSDMNEQTALETGHENMFRLYSCPDMESILAGNVLCQTVIAKPET